LRTRERQEAARPSRTITSATQRIWVDALGRYGSAALSNPWNAYRGDYSDASLVCFGLGVRKNGMDDENIYLTSNALALLAKHCKDVQLQDRWEQLHSLLASQDDSLQAEWPDE
jgi:hypothetical protein